jgi:(S)-ureidoglycine aminohydrolase
MHHLGLTRSANRRDHLLLTPDTFIRTPLPGLTNGTAIVHVAPAAGAAFTMMTVELEPGGKLTDAPTQRFIYILGGELTLAEPIKSLPHTMTAGSFAYLPTDYPHTLTAQTKARAVVIDKPFLPLDPTHQKSLSDSGASPYPEFLIGNEQDVPSTPLNGDEDLQVRSLLPASHAFDFACNTMTYAPGAALSQVEVHYMEHGLLMLEGGGIYRLGNEWYPTQAGDFIWMAPYCPQWFGAIGKQPAKYLIYKDFNRHTLA